MANQTAPRVRENKMGTMREGKLLFNMALPLIMSMLVQALYNVVDSIYVSQISESAVTALGLAFPVQNLLTGFAVGIGVGVNSLLSKSLGEGNQEQVNKTAGNGIVLMLLASVLFMLFGIFASRPFFAIQSTVAETVDGGTAYLTIVCLFSAGVFIQVLCERLLQASGKTVYTMFTQGLGAIVNIILDPIFIFGYFGIPAMGLAGAAIATVIGQWAGAVLGIFLNIKCNSDIHIHGRYVRIDPAVSGKILSIGIPSIVMTGIGSVMTFGMNQILQGFTALGETATSVFGIYFKLQSFFFMPVFGLNNAAISIVAYNYGARNKHRITKTLKLSAIAACSIMVVGLLAFQLVPQLLLGIFNPTENFLAIGNSALRIISLSFPLAGVAIALGASFQALGNGIYSTITSLCRQLVVLLPVAWLMSLTGDVHMVWWAFPIAELVSMLLTILFFLRIYRQKIKNL